MVQKVAQYAPKQLKNTKNNQF